MVDNTGRGFGRSFRYDPAFIEESKTKAAGKCARKNTWRLKLLKCGGFYPHKSTIYFDA